MDLQLPGPDPGEGALDRSFRDQGQAWTWGLAGVSVALGAWVSFAPRPSWPSIIATAGLPWLACAVVARSRGAIALSRKRGSAEPNAAAAILLPIVLLLVRANADWDVVDWTRTLVPVAVAEGGLLLLVILLVRRLPAQRLGAACYLGGFGLAYCYAVVVILNCGLDASPPYLRERAVVERHRIAQGKHTTYFLTVNRWNGTDTDKEIPVRGAVYSAHADQSVVVLAYYPGKLGIPWYRIR